MRRVVTIDGPAGAGKSTVARRVAERLGWRFLDTGAMYRAVTLAALRRGVELESEDALTALVEELEVRFPHGGVELNGEDVAHAIREPRVTAAARYAADCAGVRRRLVEWQRRFAAEHDTVTEGRDQGTIVFPDAFRKFYLTASDEQRARRRLAELSVREPGLDFESVLDAIRRRDAADAARAIAPMRPADDALVIDTTELELDVVVRRVLEVIEHGTRT